LNTCRSELPLRLVLFRLVQDWGGPVHVSELAEALDDQGRRPSRHEMLNRLSELASGRHPSLQIRRVMNGVYEAIGE
jgi:Mn-dependent DtxR family transcriptional regulator